MEIKETYNSLQQEVDVKTKKLKKVSPTLLGDSAGWGSAGKDASFLWTVFVRAGGVRMLGSVVQLVLLLRVCGGWWWWRTNSGPPTLVKLHQCREQLSPVPLRSIHTGSFHMQMSMMRLLCVCV